MGKKKKQKSNNEPKVAKATLEELSISRDGGQIALRGYSYQFLYSCYLILSSADSGTVFTLEGIEDIDTVKYKADGKHTTHIQLKYSTGNQDASFILLRDYDITDETMMQAFLLQSVAFAEASYDYLVMLIADGEGKIIPNALKFPKRAFQCIQSELNGEDFEYIEDFTSPFPVEVTSDMLECFEGEFVLQEQSPNKEWLGRIGDIGEELWVYSKTRELLSDESDRKYLNDSLTTVRIKIDDMLGLLGSLPNSETESLIRDLCSEVYAGKVFDDEKYNELIDCIQAMSTIKDQ